MQREATLSVAPLPGTATDTGTHYGPGSACAPLRAALYRFRGDDAENASWFRHTLPVAVGTVEVRGDVVLHRRFERREASVVACPVQIFDLGLREILVLATDRRRHLDVLDVGGATSAANIGGDQVAERARRAGADVEDAETFGVSCSARHFDVVLTFMMSRFSSPTPIAVAMRLEQLHAACSARRVVEALGENSFAPLVLFGPNTLKTRRPALAAACDRRGAAGRPRRGREGALAEALEVHRTELAQRRRDPSSAKPSAPSP